MYKTFNLLCIISTYCTVLVYGIKSLKDNPGFDNTAAWESNYLPCALEQVVFPETYAALLPLPKQVDISGFILPHDGAILINQDMTIDLSGETTNNLRSCENGRARRAYIKQPKIRKWYDPQSWNVVLTKGKKVTDGKAFLKDLQRVPCDNEPVIISPKGPIAIDLEYATYMRMGQLSLAGSLVTKEYVQYLLSTDLGKLMFHNNEGVNVEYYRDGVCGCHHDFTQFIETVCHNVLSNCEKPRCLDPILNVAGSCCALCGAVMRFDVAHCDDGKLQEIKTLLEKKRSNKNMQQILDFDLSYFNSKKNGKFLQIIVADRSEYNEHSVAFLKEINATTNWTAMLQGPQRLEIIYSGRPYNNSVSFFSMLLIVLCLIFVLFVALVIFANYKSDNQMLRHVPSWIYDIRHWRGFLIRTQHAFARFENVTNFSRRNTLGDVQETTMGNTNVGKNIVISYNSESVNLRERSFNNPMFNKTPTEKNETEFEEPEATLETGSLQSAQEHSSHNIQELKEINLDSTSDDESDIDA